MSFSKSAWLSLHIGQSSSYRSSAILCVIITSAVMTQWRVTQAADTYGSDGPVMACDVPGPGCGDACCDSGAPSSPGGVGKGNTSNAPVYFLEGAAIERAIDLELPGAALDWLFARTYSSGFVQESGGSPVELLTPLGTRWSGSARGPYLYDHSGGFVSHVDVVFSASSKRAFVISGTDYIPPTDYNATLVKATIVDVKDYDKDSNLAESFDVFTLTESDSGEVYVFCGFDSGVATGYKGRLVERTNRAYFEDGKDGQIFSYNANGYVTSMVPAEPQDTEYLVSFSYYTSGSESGRIQKVEVSKSSTVIAKAEYTYYGTYGGANSSLGSTGDLLQVKVSKKASGDTGGTFSIVRCTQYRYYLPEDVIGGNNDAGEQHQLKMVFESDALQRAVDYSDSDEINSPEDLFNLGDDDPIGEGGTPVDLKEFASRGFTYYVNSYDGLDNRVNTSDSYTTAWGSEILSGGGGKYGGSDYDESVHPFFFSTDSTGMVKSETISGACASCGTVAPGSLRRDYYYVMQRSWQYSGDDLDKSNAVGFLVIEDTVDSTGSAQYRRIYGTNHNGVAVREVLLTNPMSVSANNAWCWSSIYNGSWRITERRLPSAHKGEVTSNAELQTFLDPWETSDNTQANDTATVSSTEGVVYYYEYNGDGYPTGTLVRRGAGSGSKYYVDATDWTDFGQSGSVNYLPSATYSYPTKTATRADGKKTDIGYSFWTGTNDTVVKVRTTKAPGVATAENGPGTADGDRAKYEEYFDRLGRLRWTKDAEGYVNYSAYHPATGRLAYQAVDINNPASPGSEITSGSSGKWIAWTADGADSNYPTRGGGLPTGLGLITKIEYDDQARPVLAIDSRATKHFVLYHDNRILKYHSWDAANNRPFTPIDVTEFDDANNTTATYAVDPARTAQTGGVPTGLSAGTTQAHYVSWSRSFYNVLNGQHVKTLRYHDIPSTGSGTHITNYYVMAYDYDSLGRRRTTYETVDNISGVIEQLTRSEYDKLDRVTAVKKAASPAGHSLGLDTGASGTLGTISDPSSPALTTISTNEYDSGSVGDGHVTKTRKYHTASVYTDEFYHRTFRGFARGVERQYTSGSTADVTPYRAMDVDWLGRTIVAAGYTTEPTWSTLQASEGDAAYVSSTSSGRFERADTMYDVVGRVYRTERYPGTSTNKLQVNNYYDRKGQLVCTGDKYSAHTEYAYDGASRQYQERKVKDVASTKYSSGVFQYRAPAPHPAISSMSGTGNDGLASFIHLQLDAAGNEIGRHEFEVNHLDTDGVDIDATDSYVRRTIYTWFDAADRIEAIADYGAGDGDGEWNWQYSVISSRPTTAPSWTTSMVYNGYALLTRLGYEAATGRQNLVEIGVRNNGSNTSKSATKTYYDDLGRQLFVVENWDGSYNPLSSPTSSAAANRTTGWKYNGLGDITELIAYNSNSTSQLTRYFYADAYNTAFCTNVVYPDSSETAPVSATATPPFDQIRRVYNLDGSLASFTDQRGVIHEYTYTNLRQLEFDKATILSGSGVYGSNSETDAVRSIKRTYDSRGRLSNVYSYNDVAGSGTVLNRINNFYYDSINDNIGLFWFSNQYHDATTPNAVADLRLITNTSGIYNNGLRSRGIAYPNNDFQVNYESGNDNPYANAENFDDRFDRISGLEIDANGDNGVGGTSNQVTYNYTGSGRHVGADYLVPQIRQHAFSTLGGIEYITLDQWARVKEIFSYNYASGVSIVDDIMCSYDFAGNRTTQSNEMVADRFDVFSYDGLMRLTKSLSGGNTDATAKFRQKWTLDALGNWTEFQQDGLPTYATLADNDFSDATDSDQDRVHNKVNELDLNENDVDGPGDTITVAMGQADWNNSAYDKAGNMYIFPRPANPVGLYYTQYDAWNRAVQISTISFSTVQKNEYDGLHRRIVKEKYVAGDLDETRHYYYNEAWQVLEERLEVGGTIDPQPINRYVWHPRYVDALAFRLYDADTDGNLAENTDGTYYYLQDANYNVTSTVNASGAVVERYVYTSYGVPTVLHGATDFDGAVTEGAVDTGGSDIGNTCLYTGRERDSETGLQLNRNRFYASHLGRWLTRDPIGYEAGPNLYAYVDDSPVNSMDPTGEKYSGGYRPPPGKLPYPQRFPPRKFPPTGPGSGPHGGLYPPPPPRIPAPPRYPLPPRCYFDPYSPGGWNVGPPPRSLR